MNCSVNASIGMPPFKALYGRDPPNVFATPTAPSHNANVAALIEERTELLQVLKKRLHRAQSQMAEFANQKRREVVYDVGDKVLLRLQPYRQHSIGRPISAKLAKRYYGPYTITEKIGAVAYRLQLPVDSRIHDVFHVSLLKPFVPPLSDTAAAAGLPPLFRRNRPVDVPVRASAERTILVKGIPQLQWLVEWSSDNANTSWEPTAELKLHFPNLRLADKAVVLEGGVDRDSTTITNEETEDHDSSEKEDHERKDEDRSIAQSRPKRVTSRPIRWKDYVTK